MDIQFAQPEFGKCPVCGAAGGNCKGEESYHGSINIEPRKKDDPRATFRVPRRVYEEKKVGSKTVRSLLYARGDAITPAEAKRLGFLPSD